MTGRELLGHLLADLLVKGGIVLVALVLAVVAGTMVWRMLS